MKQQSASPKVSPVSTLEQKISHLLDTFEEGVFDRANGFGSVHTRTKEEATQAIQDLINKEKVEELKELLKYYERMTWEPYDTTSHLKDRIRELEGDVGDTPAHT